MIINRENIFLKELTKGLKIHPAVALLGPRQCGKTTLAKTIFKQQNGKDENYFDLEDSADLLRLETPKFALKPLKGLIVIDEIQRKPDLFPTLRTLIDDDPEKRWLILGSASRDLIQQSSETLAGRIEYLELTPFTLKEVKNLSGLWLRGGFPRSFLAEDDSLSMRWRKAYIKTFLERDLASLGVRISPMKLERFWFMLAHYHGQVINYSELGNSLQLSHNTIRHYVDLLAETFMIKVLKPWHENIGKRQVKTPKVYIRDSGIFHSLLDIDSKDKLERHPKLGASWEGFALEEILRMSLDPSVMSFFWRTHAGAELDLLLLKGYKRIGFEFKFSDAPKITRSMQESIESLKLDALFIIIPNKARFQLAKNIHCFGLEEFVSTQSTADLLD